MDLRLKSDRCHRRLLRPQANADVNEKREAATLSPRERVGPAPIPRDVNRLQHIQRGAGVRGLSEVRRLLHLVVLAVVLAATALPLHAQLAAVIDQQLAAPALEQVLDDRDPEV